jgi:hypothetical protein
MKLWDDSQSKMEICADIPISLYVINCVNNIVDKTIIVSVLKRKRINTESKEYLNPKYSIPLAYHSIFEKLIKLIESNANYKMEVKLKTVKSEGEQIPLPEKYSVNDNYAIDTYRVKDGYFVKKMTETHPDMKKMKLIIANKASFEGSIIDEGRLGLTGNHKYYILGEKLEDLQQLFETKIGHIVSHYTKYGQDFLDKDAFEYLPDVRNIPIEILPEVTDKNLYKLLKLTKDEIKLIETTN